MAGLNTVIADPNSVIVEPIQQLWNQIQQLWNQILFKMTSIVTGVFHKQLLCPPHEELPEAEAKHGDALLRLPSARHPGMS